MGENGKTKEYEELNFSDNFMFCKVLTNNPDLCKELTETILGTKIGLVLKAEEQKAVEITANGRGVRFDVYLEDDESKIYDIEMQTTLKSDLPKRARYYQEMMDLNHLNRGDDYRELKKSYVIFICISNPFPKVGLHKYSFKNTCMEDASVEYDDETRKIFLAAKGTANDVSGELKAFLDYLVTKKPTSDMTRRMEDDVEMVRRHDEFKMEYMSMMAHDADVRAEGREEGRAEERIESRIESINNVMDSLKVTAAEAMDILKIPEEERADYLSRL